MKQFKLKTSLPFPIFSIPTEHIYSNYSLPTGIVYILLVLIYESKNKRTKLKTQLTNFGIPLDLHYIFAREIQKLIDLEMILMRNKLVFSDFQFDEYFISDFQFTKKGLRAYKDEVIFNDKKKVYQHTSWFNPVTNEYSLSNKYTSGGMEYSVIPEHIYKKTCSKDEKELEYITDRYGKKEFNVSKENILNEVKITGTTKNMFFKYDCILNISLNKHMSISFKDDNYNRFITKYYDKDVIEQGLLNKRKFQFDKSIKEFGKGNLLSQENTVGLFFPSHLSEIKQTQDTIIFSSVSNNKNQLLKKTIFSNVVSKIRQKYALVKLTKNGKVSSYVPTEVKIYLEELKQEITMKLLVEQTLHRDDVNIFMKELVSQLVKDELTESVVDLLNQIDNYVDSTNLESYLNYYKPSVVKDLITFMYKLVEMKVATNQRKEYIAKVIDTRQDAIVKTAQNLNMFKEIRSIYYISGKSDMQLLKSIITTSSLEGEKLFEYLIDIGFSETTIFNNTNLFNFYYDKFKSGTKLSGDSNITNLFNEYLSLSNRVDEKLNVFNEDYTISNGFDKAQFKDFYTRISALKSQLMKYQKYTKDNMSFIDKKYQVYKKVNEEIDSLSSIENKPNKLTKKKSKELLAKGYTFILIISLSRKLEIVLSDVLKNDGDLKGLIYQYSQLDGISKDTINVLHNLRKTRNSFVHGNSVNKVISKEEISEYINSVFSIKGVKK